MRCIQQVALGAIVVCVSTGATPRSTDDSFAAEREQALLNMTRGTSKYVPQGEVLWVFAL